MNYWPAEPAGLPECHEPLLDWLEDLARSGQRTARALYGLPGWTAHHNADRWAFTAPVGDGAFDPVWSMWPLAGRSEEHTSELQSRGHLVCRLLLALKQRHLSGDEPA